MDLTTQPKWVQALFRVLAVGVIVGAFWLMRSCSWTPPDKVQLREMLRQECGAATKGPAPGSGRNNVTPAKGK